MADAGWNTYQFKPKCIEDTVDAGVHPIVARMRLSQKGTDRMGDGQIVAGMDLKATPWIKKEAQSGYTYNKRNGAASACSVTDVVPQLDRLKGHGMNPGDFFQQANTLGMDVMEGVTKRTVGPNFPDMSKGGKSKKDKKNSKKDKKGKKSKTKKKKKKKEKKSGKSKKKKGKKSSSSSSSSSGSSSKKSSSSSGDKKKKKAAVKQKKQKDKSGSSSEGDASGSGSGSASEGEKKRRKLEVDQFLNELDGKPL